MTKRKQNNSLFVHLQSVLNAVLPLEYAIRAAFLANPRELGQLSDIGKKIRQCWIDQGWDEIEIDKEFIIDFSWDAIQLGYPLVRRHGRYYPRELYFRIQNGMNCIYEKFSSDVAASLIPATNYFRICDLLGGNDIFRLLNSTAQCLKESRNYDEKDAIDLEKFLLGVRLPIYIHPGCRFVAFDRTHSGRAGKFFAFALDLEVEFSPSSLKRQIREFIYQYAVGRNTVCGIENSNDSSDDLINEFLWDDLLGRIDKHSLTRLDGFISPLSGLYCWDLVLQYRVEGRRNAVDEAISETQRIYPRNVRAVTDDAIRKNYNTARTAIERVSFDVERKSKTKNGREVMLKHF